MNFRNVVLSTMGAEDLAALLPHLEEVALAGGQVLYEPDDIAQYVYFPSDAAISIVADMSDGRAVETTTVGFESGVGFLSALSEKPAFNRVLCQVAGEALRLPASVLRSRAYASETMMGLLFNHLDLQACQAHQSVACNALHGAPSRMARWLLMTQDRTGDARLPLTQDYLSVMLGLQRTTVTIVAGELRNAGLISYRRGQITVVNREGLKAASCECYAVVRDRAERGGARTFQEG